jgi:flavin reductase (DIM6/NTAB) family NADH-FMN oxidoreductase RutF
MKLRLGPSDILFPVPAALVACGNGERANIITVAWIGMAGSDPPALSISLKQSRYSLELIRGSGDFSVNIPPAALYRETDYCGIVTGKKRNKFSDTGFTPLPASKISAPIIKECPFNIECRVMNEVPVGRWVLVIGEVVETHADGDRLLGSKMPDIDAMDPLVYCATIREYRKIGKKLGDGFSSGREILRRLKG